jgi:hypothetical protein
MAEVELTEDDVQAKMEELIFRMIDGQGPAGPAGPAVI